MGSARPCSVLHSFVLCIDPCLIALYCIRVDAKNDFRFNSLSPTREIVEITIFFFDLYCS